MRDNAGDVAVTGEYLHPPLGLVQAAVTYYGSYAAEIDEWMQRNEHDAAEAHAASRAGQAALRR